MKLAITSNCSTLLFALFTVSSASPQTADRLPSADDVVGKMMQVDSERRAEMPGYRAARRYVAVNGNRRAEMVVRVECSADGAKEFAIISEKGSRSIRKHALYKMLSEENEASRRESREGSRITPANYRFKIIGQETLETGPAYVLAITPKTENKYLIDGKIWVGATDYSIVRIEGQPARNPSFWVHDVHFVHTYQRVGQFWFAASTHTTSEVRIFGPSELTIDNSDYVLNSPKDRTAETESVARLVP
jgi:hypothetical protein